MRAFAAWPSTVLRSTAIVLAFLLQPIPVSRPYTKKAPVVVITARPESEAERYHKTLTLPDGRTLAWAEAGSPSGFPLFLFHGLPGSPLEARGVEGLGSRNDVRLIALDCPGYGHSTFQPGRRITDWPSDVQYLDFRCMPLRISQLHEGIDTLA